MHINIIIIIIVTQNVHKRNIFKTMHNIQSYQLISCLSSLYSPDIRTDSVLEVLDLNYMGSNHHRHTA